MSSHPSDRVVVYKSLSFLGCSKYEVGSDGSVWSLARPERGWKKLKGRDCHFCLQVAFVNDAGRRVHFLVHRLVLLAFVGPCPEGLEGCHEDGDFRNNNLTNLRWDTHKANMKDRDRHGRTYRVYGEDNPSSRLTDAQALRIYHRLMQGESVEAICREYGVRANVVRGIRRRQTYRLAERV